MNLESITAGIVKKPFRIVLYGIEGCGKTTFGAHTPAPVFLCSERGTEHLNVARFPVPGDWISTINALNELLTRPHEFKTLVLDSADWFERLANGAVAKENGKTSIEGIGYGKGYTMVAEKFKSLLGWLDALSDQRGMNILIIAHAHIVSFDDPTSETYSRYTLATGKKVTPILKEWPDAVLFATFDKSLTSAGDGFSERKIAKSYGERILLTEHRATHDAKNRWRLPERLPLDYATVENYLNAYYGQ